MKERKAFSKKEIGFKNPKSSIICIFIILIITILFKECYFESYIELKINAIGNITMYNEKFIFKPDKIIINDENMSEVNNYYSFNNSNNIVQLIWNYNNFSDFDYMFDGCNNITEINLSHFNFSNIISMAHMFSGCKLLISINLSKIDTSNVLNMSYMFNNCKNLESLDLSNFETSLVNNMSGMFFNCTKLNDLKITNFNTTNAVDMENLFYGCRELTSLNISSFNTRIITNMNNMFMKCSKLKSLDLSNFNTSNVKFMNDTFKDCFSLENLNIRNFDLSNINSSDYAFSGCSNLSFINFEKGILGNSKFFSSIGKKITICLNQTTNSLNSSSFNIISCSELCTSEHPFFDKHKEIYVKYCDINDLFTNSCVLKYKETEYPEDLIYDNIKMNISDFNISLLANNENLEIIENGTNFKLINSSIDKKIKDCIKNIKTFIISNNDNLILLIIDITSNDKTKKTLYEFYHSFVPNNLVKINSTDICKDILKNDIIENCSEYSIESIIKNSCIKCKNDYYPIYNDSINNDNLMKCYKNLEGYYLENSEYYKPCYETCKTCNKNGNSSIHNCISCKNDFPNLFQTNCYNQCPVNSSNSKENDYICEIKCSPEKPFEDLINHQCIDKCDINKRFNNKCKLNYVSEDTKKENFKAKVIEDIQNGTLGEVLNQVLKSNETYSFQNGDEKHSISTLSGSDSNLKKAGVTSINFGSNCQQILKGNNDNQEIILYDVEHHIEGFNTPIIEYTLFDEDGQKLDLDECNDDRVIYYIPNNINEGDLDKHDPTSDFYNNCNKGTAEEGVDMTSYENLFILMIIICPFVKRVV